MSFFDSEIVQQEMKEISELQDEIYHEGLQFSSMDSDDKLQHVEMLETLLKKQKILYTRLSLSEDLMTSKRNEGKTLSSLEEA